MPTIPSNTKCSMLGCNNHKSKCNSLCIEHGGKDVYKYKSSKDRQEKNNLYSTSQWQGLRQIQLSKHPLCAGCLSQGIVTAAIHIDHVFPWTHIGKQAFYYNVFQSLCHSCHSSKTSLEAKGIFRYYGQPNKDLTINDYASYAYSFQEANIS